MGWYGRCEVSPPVSWLIRVMGLGIELYPSHITSDDLVYTTGGLTAPKIISPRTAADPLSR